MILVPLVCFTIVPRRVQVRYKPLGEGKATLAFHFAKSFIPNRWKKICGDLSKLGTSLNSYFATISAWHPSDSKIFFKNRQRCDEEENQEYCLTTN